jgi:tetratricopeptide (TPR) repeat protein
MHRRSYRSGLLATALLAGLGLAVGPAWSDGTPSPPPPQDTSKPSDSKPKPKATTKKKKKQTQQQFFDGYRAAYNLVQAKQFEAAIASFRALEQDDHPDVANYIGYSNRQLGRYDEAKEWYDRALAADPKHVRTWQYYGMWHLEQGNRLKAEEYLATIRTLCGSTCKEYALMQDALNGNIVY